MHHRAQFVKTASAKPEVQSMSQRRQKMTEPWPHATCTEKLV